jgi:phthiocerol/phenolphthiocerol synthesis type-I polyketide synthase D
MAAASEGLALPVQAIAVNRLEVEQMLPLDDQTEITTQLIQNTENSVNDIRVEIHSRSANGNWRRHAVARVEAARPGVRAEQISSGEARRAAGQYRAYLELPPQAVGVLG